MYRSHSGRRVWRRRSWGERCSVLEASQPESTRVWSLPLLSGPVQRAAVFGRRHFDSSMSIISIAALPMGPTIGKLLEVGQYAGVIHTNMKRAELIAANRCLGFANLVCLGVRPRINDLRKGCASRTATLVRQRVTDLKCRTFRISFNYAKPAGVAATEL